MSDYTGCDDDFITVQDAAKRLQVSSRTIINWIEEGRFSAIKMGKLYRINKDSFEQALKNAEIKKSPSDHR